MLLRRFALFLIGFTATSGQILLLREFISTFHGNELVIGIYLSVWLLATAVGSGPAARLFLGGRKASPLGGGHACASNADSPMKSGGSAGAAEARSDASDARSSDDSAPVIDSTPIVRFAIVQSVSGIGLLFAVVGLLIMPSPLRPAPGEIAGLVAALASAALFLFPFCLLQGLLFPLGTRLLHSENLHAERPDGSVSRVYFLESLGAGTGGLLFSLVLVRLMSSFQNIAVLSAINLLTACLLLKDADRRRLSQLLYLVATVTLIVCVLDPVTHWTAHRRWEGFKVVALRQSHYGNLAVVSLDSQFSTYQDGLLVFTTEDVQSAEEAAHIPLLEHPAPAHVLLIGGGVGGVVREMLKCKTLTQLDYVELDPQLIDLSKEVLPHKYVSDLEDPRVSVQYTDGRRFLQKTSKRYDLVAMQIPPPYTAQLNRFYTEEFFTLVKGHLEPGGVFAFSAPPVAEYVGQELGAFLGSLSRTSESVFESNIIIPASRSFFVCSPGKNPYLVASPESLLFRVAVRGIETLFVRDYFLMSTLSRERLAYVGRRIAASKVGSINTDLRPISFYYDLVLWSAEYERFMKPVLKWIFRNRWSLWPITLAVAGMLVALARSGRQGRLVLSALAVSGFAAIVLELEILLCFQLLYGNLYDRIGVLLTAYMLGLALGTVLERRGEHSMFSGVAVPRRPALRRPAIIQIVTAVFALCFLGVIYLASRMGSGRLPAASVSHGVAVGTALQNLVNAFEWFFPIFALLAGALGGALFSSASRAFFACATSGSVGITYAWDLVGSWVGAVLCSAVLFPVVGIVTTTAIIAILLVASGLSLALARG
jgi:spermidine synthase